MQDAFNRWKRLLGGEVEEEAEVPTKDQSNLNLAAQHHRYRLLARAFHRLVIFRQRLFLMNEMSNQLYLSHMQKLTHRFLKLWHKRSLDRRNRRNRCQIAEGYYRYRVIQHTFLGWKGVIALG